MSHVLETMLTLPMPFAEKILRTIAVYVFLVVLLRWFGKRELAQLNPFDLVVLLMLSNTMQNAIIGDDTSLVGGLVGAFVLCAFNYAVVRFLFRHRRLDQLLEGSPTTLIRGGVVVREALAHELMTEAELTAVAHRQGFARLEDIDSCILEPGGGFFVQGKQPPASERQHLAIVEQLGRLERQIAEIRECLMRQGEPKPGPDRLPSPPADADPR